MLDFFVNEVVYFLLLFTLFLLVKRIFQLKVKNKSLIAVCVFVVSLHFLIVLTANIFYSRELYFPFLIDFKNDFPKAKYDYDIGNGILILYTVCFGNLIALMWGIIIIVKATIERIHR